MNGRNVCRIGMVMMTLCIFTPPVNSLGETAPMVVADGVNIAALRSDGTVRAKYEGFMVEEIEEWTDIVQVAVGEEAIVGLKRDGTVLVYGDDFYAYYPDAEDEVAGWKKITQVNVGKDFIIGLRDDGKVECAGENAEGQLSSAKEWKNMIQVAAGKDHIVGLRSDGTLEAAGRNLWGQIDVATWTDIVQITADHHHTIGLRADGYVMVTGNVTADPDYMEHINSFRDVVQVASGHYNVLVLRGDGTAAGGGEENAQQFDVGHWCDIVQVESFEDNTIGLTSKGVIVALGADKEEYESWALTEYAEGYLAASGMCYCE